MEINSTLLFVIDNFTDSHYLAGLSDFFSVDPEVSDILNTCFKNIECPPPDSLISKILANIC